MLAYIPYMDPMGMEGILFSDEIERRSVEFYVIWHPLFDASDTGESCPRAALMAILAGPVGTLNRYDVTILMTCRSWDSTPIPMIICLYMYINIHIFMVCIYIIYYV